MLPQVNVRILTADNDGPLAGATVVAQLNQADTSDGFGYVLPEPVEGVSDDNGILTLSLWPNELGTTGSKYIFLIENAQTGEVLRVQASIPNRDCDLHTVADPLASPDAVIATPIPFVGEVVGPLGVKKVNVTCYAADQNGNPVVGAIVTARLNRIDVDPAVGYIMPEEITGTADANGICVLPLWPNQRGSTQSQYVFLIENPDTEQVLKLIATVPDANCNLHLVANLPAYEGKSDGQLAIDAVLELVAPVQAAADQTAADRQVVALASADAVNAAIAAKTSEDAAKMAEDAALVSKNAAAGSANAANTSQLAALASEIAAEAAQATTEATRDAAVTAKDTAVNKASEAAGWATAAKSSETNSGINAGVSINKAAEAAASATSANNAKTAAETAKNVTDGLKADVTLLHTAVQTAKTAVDTARSAAEAAKTAAEGAQSKAATSETNAAASAATATTKAGEASGSAVSASNSANTATTKAGEAATSAGTAVGAANTATTKAGEALVSANAAKTSETNSKTSETNAAASAASLAATLASLNSTWLGHRDTEPTVDGNGGPLKTGMTYFNTVTKEQMVYIDGQWRDPDEEALSATANAQLSAAEAAVAAANAKISETNADASEAAALVHRNDAGWFKDRAYEARDAAQAAHAASNYARDVAIDARNAAEDFSELALAEANRAVAAADMASANQVQADWVVVDPANKAFIKNKPSIPVLNNPNVIAALGYTPWHAGNDGYGSGLDADRLQGFLPAYAPIGGTVVVRDGSGYVEAVHYKMTTIVTPRYNDTVFYSSSNDYLYKNDAAGMRSSLGLGNVENKSSDTIRREITHADVIQPLGWGSTGTTGLEGPMHISAAANYNAGLPSGFFQFDNAANAPVAGWGNLLNLRHDNPNNQHGWQLFSTYYGSGVYYRTYAGGTNGSTGTFAAWRQLLDSENYHQYNKFNSYVQAKGFVSDETDMIRVVLPSGASYKTTEGSKTGAIKITLPNGWTNAMLSMRVRIYEYAVGQSIDLYISGYNYTDGGGSWYNTTAYIVGDPRLDLSYPIRFGFDGAKCCVYIGEANESWSYPQVTVMEFMAGHDTTSNEAWNDGWDVSIVQEFQNVTGIVVGAQVGRQINGNEIWHEGNVTASRLVSKISGAAYLPTLTLAKNNSEISGISYQHGNVELRTDDGSFPILGFHASGRFANALYSSNVGVLRLRDSGNNDHLMLHTGNIHGNAVALYAGTSIGISGSDLNNLTTTGFYRGENLANAPGVGWWHITCESHGSGWYKQVATSFGSGNAQGYTYQRTCFGGPWSHWVLVTDGTWGIESTVKKRRERYHSDDGSSISNIGMPETGFDYNTGGQGFAGPFIHWGHLTGVGGAYGCQMAAYYSGSGDRISFRTNNGDTGAWNSWHEFWHSGNLNPQENAVGNSVVKRNVNGYVFGNFINMTDDGDGAANNVPITAIIAKKGDNYYRSSSAQQIKDFLGLRTFQLVDSTHLTDLNTLIRPGMYSMKGGPVNGPNGSQAYNNLLVIASGNHDVITQIYGDFASSKLWTRSGNNFGVNWAPWRRLAWADEDTLYKPTIRNFIEQSQLIVGDTVGNVVNVNLDNGTMLFVATRGNTTINLPAAPSGTSYTIVVEYGSTGHTVSFAGGGALRWAGGTAPQATSVQGKIDKFVFTSILGATLAQDGGRNF